MLVPQTKTKLNGYTVYFHNSEEFHLIKGEVFTQRIYDFDFPALEDSTKPLIVDAGAHIGLTSLFFAKEYPQAQILALEPQPDNYKLLEKNIWENQLERVETRPLALAGKTTESILHIDTVWDWFSTASLHQGAWTGNQETKQISVKTISLSDLLKELEQPIDLLKLDIEGSEQAVLESAKKDLTKIRSMVIEFHPHKQQSAGQLQALLEKAGFTVTFWKKGKKVDPKKSRGLLMVTAFGQL